MTRIVIIDDDPLVRSGLRMIIESADDLSIVAEGGDGADAVDLVREHRPDVVLMDIRMPAVDGLAATALVRAEPQPPQVIVLTTFDLDDYVMRALQAGAAGFMLKDTPPRQLLDGVRVVASGEAMLSPSVTRKLIDRFAGDPREDRRRAALARIAVLTEREHEVFLGIAAGGSNAQIGRDLFMSEATVKTHVSRLLDKLDVANRVQLAILAHDAGLPRR
ncbi:LuxR family transcriptional regulator [Tsukamurella pulmonis]|uniref:DNA-binding response regulator, NarL/FixJ family, contains REC and HTH domains n=1 Tax=Tsukamurella pulmonis TaxID=47312 RepID=A0A1H1GQ39_9ACTN|nr:response regulator transcription factor [Tsukamurella pulmonis]KXO88331.1 LuxR family transcriptional regulator [Tsukamurella pulmonis]KXP13309.1 LuxR family transcriptional regulator [Tsukamurella pulmonis]RDH13304.1 DNA-binding response regulator [Tsukamurella pulmonis]SDR15018.1 DNA-binding response regulator, NarL/FixJ family, contains REC and HTH domains [Tsukamurella pulmonis]SUP16917.1 Response regulator protein vraR [Tsukamurella pulmonis]